MQHCPSSREYWLSNTVSLRCLLAQPYLSPQLQLQLQYSVYSYSYILIFFDGVLLYYNLTTSIQINAHHIVRES